MYIRMKCPYCHARLVKGALREFETLCDHITNPNEKPPLRVSYICPNYCPLGKNSFWDIMGESYPAHCQTKGSDKPALYSPTWLQEKEAEWQRSPIIWNIYKKLFRSLMKNLVW